MDVDSDAFFLLTQNAVEKDSEIERKHAIQTEDSVNAVKRANLYFQSQYPAEKSGFNVLSFKFGLVAIIHESIGHVDLSYQLLKLVVGDADLLNTCMLSVRGILLDRNTKQVYLDNLNTSFDILRDKHVVSVIVKVLLLPLVLAWFRDAIASTCLMSSLPNGKGKAQEIRVKVVMCPTGLKNHFMEIEKVVLRDNNCIDYFA